MCTATNHCWMGRSGASTIPNRQLCMCGAMTWGECLLGIKAAKIERSLKILESNQRRMMQRAKKLNRLLVS